MTHKVWIGVYIASAALWAQPPSTAITGLPGEKGAYYRGAAGWVSLPLKPIMAFKEGSAKQLLGVGAQDAVIEMPGPHAAIRISNARPTFYMRGMPAGSRLYLVQGVEKEDYREIRMSMTRRFPNTPRFRHDELNEVELEAVANDVVAVKPKGDLRPGEYVLVSVPDLNYRWIRVGFDFGVSSGR